MKKMYKFKTIFSKSLPILLLPVVFILFGMGILAHGRTERNRVLLAPCSGKAIDAVCGPRHMTCIRGIPLDVPADDNSAYRWSCIGSNNGLQKNCREAKVIKTTPTPPPTPTPALPQACHATFMGWWDWCAVLPTARYILSILLAVFSSGAVLMLIYGGILYITSNGDSEKTSHAKKVITYTLLAVLIVTATWGLISLTASLIGAG